MTFEDFNKTLQDFGTIIINNNEGEPQVVHYPSISFYGCSFNFEKEGCAESRYYGGDDIYNQGKEVQYDTNRNSTAS